VKEPAPAADSKNKPVPVKNPIHVMTSMPFQIPAMFGNVGISGNLSLPQEIVSCTSNEAGTEFLT